MKYLSILQSRKPSIVLKILLNKITSRRLAGFQKVQDLFVEKLGIEIGGPSFFFTEKGNLPVYSLANKIDGCNFSSNTLWEENLENGDNYQYTPGKLGYQFICDGVDVSIIPTNAYDFLLSCNSLEHIANPLLALENWLRLLKADGVIVLILPRKESNFDHKRPITSFSHLLNDYNYKTGEEDLTHLEEVLELHDLKLDIRAGDFSKFKKRLTNNFINRGMHHHVFDLDLLVEICNFLDLNIVYKESLICDNLIIATRKTNS